MDEKLPKRIKKCDDFPKITKLNNTVESPRDPHYNCIAWAVEEKTIKWWPAFVPDTYWPPSAPNSTHISSFIKAFETKGFTVCENGESRDGYEKIAIYEKNGQVTHAARRISATRWASKLGRSFDIHHTTDAVSGGLYGQITTYMERKLDDASKLTPQQAIAS